LIVLNYVYLSGNPGEITAKSPITRAKNKELGERVLKELFLASEKRKDSIITIVKEPDADHVERRLGGSLLRSLLFDPLCRFDVDGHSFNVFVRMPQEGRERYTKSRVRKPNPV
jgi:hypothetical protein